MASFATQFECIVVYFMLGTCTVFSFSSISHNNLTPSPLHCNISKKELMFSATDGWPCLYFQKKVTGRRTLYFLSQTKISLVCKLGSMHTMVSQILVSKNNVLFMNL